MDSRTRFLRGRKALLAWGFGALLVSCNVTDRDLGNQPVGPGENPGGSLEVIAGGWVRDSVSGNMRIFSTPHTLKAGNKGKAIVTVRLLDINRNPVGGRLVRFAASLGSITAADTTDAGGTATAEFASVPQNGEARILAAATLEDTLAFVGTTILLSGLRVEVIPLSPDTSVGTVVPVDIAVTDGDGEPVPGAQVRLTGAQHSSGVTNGAGTFRTSVTRESVGQARITASALNAADSVSVSFWNEPPVSRSRTLLVFAEPAHLPAAHGGSSTIRAVLFDSRHNPIAGKEVSFSATHGIITPSDVTADDGTAEATFSAVARNVDAVITASYRQGESVQSATATVTLAGLQLEVNVPSTEVLVGENVPLSLRLRDASGRALPDVTISLTGATRSSVTTNASGVATATVASTEEQLVTVKASALGAVDSVRVVFLRALPPKTGSVGNLRIFAEKPTLRASNTDQTTVRVTAFDRFNNPLSGRPVRFIATQGIITSQDTTDERGEATAVYRAVPINTDARITATMTLADSAQAVATTITLAGLEIDVAPSLADALLNRAVPLTIRIVDGAGSPVPDARIEWNGTPGVGVTDGKGEFRTTITSGAERRVSVVAKALGAVDSGSVNFWKVLPSPDPDVNTIREMRIFSSRSQLKADNSDFALVTVILTNENNNPAAGEKVRFSSNLGIIDQEAVVDSSGRAVATLRSAAVNGVCRVTATAVGRNLTATTDVVFSGITLKLLPERTEMKIGELVSIEASLRDGSGNPIGGDDVTFTLTGAGEFDNGNKTFTTPLNPNGRALVRVTSEEAGTIKLTASALNSSDTLSLLYTNNSLTVTASPTALTVGGGDSTAVTATYLDGQNNPIGGAVIQFSANAGELSRTLVTTDGSGKATTHLRSALFSGTATVQANAAGGVAQVKVTFSASAPQAVKLTITPDNISANGGTATLRAVVTDAQGNMVSGEDVNFRIIKGPGGGESILKPLVTTQGGEATSQLVSGTIPSAYRGVLVVATVAGKTDTSKLTISGPAHLVTVARPENDTVVVKDVGVIDESVFELFVGAVAQDINGNFVADGTEVHFSAVVTGMAVGVRTFGGWLGLGDSATNVRATFFDRLVELPFEDINNNFKYDKGIDVEIDFDDTRARRGEDANGDGVFDWNPALPTRHDTWFDLNGNGLCDVGQAEPTVVVGRTGNLDTIFADVIPNGVWDRSELLVDRNGDNQCTLPASGDYPYTTWESRGYLAPMDFRHNEYAVAIEVSAVTKNGVAKARIRYPRQLGNRLYVTVNAEVNGMRDRDGERMLLPVIRKE